jgi:circadian clock protein KaiC
MAAQARSTPMVVVPRAPTGIPGLDRMLHGGLPRGRPYLLTGPNGSGRTLLGLQFLIEGIRRGEPVLLVAVDEPPTEILENVRAFGWDLSKIHTLDANPGQMAYRRLGNVQEIKSLGEIRSMGDAGEAKKPQSSSEDITMQSIYLRLRRQMEVLPARRVVIDSMTSIRHFALRVTGDPQADRTEIQSLLRFLSEKEVTTLVTALPSPATELSPEQILCRGEIVLRRDWHGNSMRRTIQVSRLRGSDHDGDEHPVSIGPDGIKVEDGVPVRRD